MTLEPELNSIGNQCFVSCHFDVTDIFAMDICHIPYRFSVTPFEFSHVRRNFCLPRSQTTPFCPRIPVASNSLSETDSPEPKSRNRMFILGMGFVGQFFSQALKNQGWYFTLPFFSMNNLFVFSFYIYTILDAF